MFSVLMTDVAFTERIVVGGIEIGFIRRSFASRCRYESEQRYKVGNYALIDCRQLSKMRAFTERSEKQQDCNSL